MARKNVSGFCEIHLILAQHLAIFRCSCANGQQRVGAKGQYIFSVAGLLPATAIRGTQHAGGRAIPFSTVYSTNLTADKETGWAIGRISRFLTR
jgi:hypothetical protein